MTTTPLLPTRNEPVELPLSAQGRYSRNMLGRGPFAEGSVRINVNLSAQDNEALRVIAAQEGRHLSDVVRDAVLLAGQLERAKAAGKSLYVCDAETGRIEKEVVIL